MENSKSILVVGGGLSGVCVAYQLIRSGVHVTLIDSGENHSSVVAAGMINPLVFRRMNKSWRVDEFMPYLTTFYATLERETGTSFFHPVVIRRLFSSDQERTLWCERETTPAYENYMTPLTEEDLAYSETINPFGSGRVKNAFHISPIPFLRAMKNLIAARGALISEAFDYTQLSDTHYKEIAFDDIVFCEGYLGKKNPWFGELPLNQTKGELLTIRAESLPEHESVNRKCFVLPLGEHQFKVGSTYVWNTATTNITLEGRSEILGNLTYLTKEEVEILDQKAGIRPTTKDRRPLIGTHSSKKNYHFFNGLGAKGYMLAPLLSDEFCKYLLNGASIDPEVDLNRFTSKR